MPAARTGRPRCCPLPPSSRAGGHHGCSQGAHFRFPLQCRRADLSRPRNRRRLLPQPRQGQGALRRDHRPLRRPRHPLGHQGHGEGAGPDLAPEGHRPGGNRRRQRRCRRRHGARRHRDEYALRQFDHHRRTRHRDDVRPGAADPAGRCLDPGRQVGEEPLHGRGAHRQDARHHRMRQYRRHRRRPRGGPEAEGRGLRPLPLPRNAPSKSGSRRSSSTRSWRGPTSSRSTCR